MRGAGILPTLQMWKQVHRSEVTSPRSHRQRWDLNLGSLASASTPSNAALPGGHSSTGWAPKHTQGRVLEMNYVNTYKAPRVVPSILRNTPPMVSIIIILILLDLLSLAFIYEVCVREGVSNWYSCSFPEGLRGEESTCQCKRCRRRGFSP